MSDKPKNKKIIDWKLRFRAITVWWRVVFLFLFIIILFVIPRSGMTLPMFIIKCLIISAIAALPLDIILIYVIFPLFFNKQRRIHIDLMKRFRTEGFSSGVISEMEIQLDVCRKKSVYSNYTNIYSELLANYYIEEGKLDRAKAALDAADLQGLYHDSDTVTAQTSIITYHALKIQYAAESKDTELADRYYDEGEKYFTQFYGKTDHISFMADYGRFYHKFVHGGFEDCGKLMEKYISADSDNIRCDANSLLGLALGKQGRREEAERCFEAAEELAKLYFTRNVILKKRKLAFEDEMA